MKNSILLLLVISTLVIAQDIPYQLFDKASTRFNHSQSSIVQTSDSSVLFFWCDSSELFYSKANFEFTDWSNPILLDDGIFNTDTLMEINSLCISNNQESINGRILVTYKKKDGHYLKYSDDNGINWSEPILLPLGGIVSQKYINSTGFSELKNGNVIFTYTLYNTSLTAIREIGYLASIDGITWDLRKTLFAWADYNFASINSLNDSTLILTAQKYNENSTDIVISYSNIDSINFIDEQIILSTNIKNPKPRTQIDNSGKIHLVYVDNRNSYENYNQSNIYYTTSTDNGLTWEASQKITNYLGNDTNPKLSLINDQPVLSFTSARNLASLYHQNNNSIYYGVVGVSEDLLTPPIHLLENIQQSFTFPFGKLIINETIIDDESVGLVEFNYSINSGAIKTIELFDDGNHNDQLSGDDIFGNSIDSLSNLDTVNYVLLFSDANTNIAQTMERRVIINNPQLDSTFYVDINNIKLPIDNKGNTADAGIIDSLGNNFDGGKFDESTFLFSGGFVLSGLNNGDIWANGMTSASRMEDYIPGKIGLENEQYDKVIYVVKSFDKPFGDSWHYWINAVKAGAEFYDGDGNGLYEPIDLNNNGIWDTNEDKPLIMGDLTAWCVYNDGVPAPLRKYENINPLGIEIEQTVFAYSPKTHSELANVIFIRYKISNTGLVNDLLDSVYFGIWSDPDIGQYENDLVGSDTTLNSGYCYDNSSDGKYGINSPSFFSTLIQGPVSYIPNITFNDVNNNNIYDEGIDDPLDTAKSYFGPFQQDAFLGAANLGISSAIHYIGSHPTQGDPREVNILQCYLEGKNGLCEFINPCEWEFGIVNNINCESVNPLFMYSGDPVANSGWICNLQTDQRLMANTGTFQLEKDKPQEIIIAYVVGRGNTSLESINTAKDITKDAIAFYNSNFTEIPVSVKETKNENIPTKFVLEQNYPNPFNPTTTIKYQIPNNSVIARSDATRQSNEITSGNSFPRNDNVNVRLTVYDILGREITTLVNQKQKPGIYEINFDAIKYSSGVYYYQLKVSQFIKTKKMILLK